MNKTERIQKALEILVRGNGIRGHEDYYMDQAVRALTDCPMVKKQAKDYKGSSYEYETFGESKEYIKLVQDARDGEDGPDTYGWETGTPP